jgi:hypothetical protein
MKESADSIVLSVARMVSWLVVQYCTALLQYATGEAGSEGPLLSSTMVYGVSVVHSEHQQAKSRDD